MLQFCQYLPKSVPAARKLIGQNIDEFQKWVCCPSCKSLYGFDDCKKRGVNGQLISKQCGFVRYPAHVHQQRRQPCGQLLLRPLEKSSVSFALKPKAIFCYNSLIHSLSKLVRRADFF